MTRHSKTHVDQVEKDVERGKRLQAWNNLGDCTFAMRFDLWICFWLQQLHAQAAAESLRDPTLSKQRRRMMLALVEARWMLGQFGALHGKLVGAVSQAGTHGIPCHGYISNMYTHYNIHIIIYIYIIILLLLLYNYIII